MASTLLVKGINFYERSCEDDEKEIDRRKAKTVLEKVDKMFPKTDAGEEQPWPKYLTDEIDTFHHHFSNESDKPGLTFSLIDVTKSYGRFKDSKKIQKTFSDFESRRLKGIYL